MLYIVVDPVLKVFKKYIFFLLHCDWLVLAVRFEVKVAIWWPDLYVMHFSWHPIGQFLSFFLVDARTSFWLASGSAQEMSSQEVMVTWYIMIPNRLRLTRNTVTLLNEIDMGKDDAFLKKNIMQLVKLRGQLGVRDTLVLKAIHNTIE